jgi:hypothetical protein
MGITQIPKQVFVSHVMHHVKLVLEIVNFIAKGIYLIKINLIKINLINI